MQDGENTSWSYTHSDLCSGGGGGTLRVVYAGGVLRGRAPQQNILQISRYTNKQCKYITINLNIQQPL